MDAVYVVAAALLGACIGSTLACVPGLHVYNLLALVILATQHITLPAQVLVPFITAMVVGYAMLNTIPSILLAAPDESAMFTVLPGQKYLRRGRGMEGVMLTTAGGVVGLVLILVVLAPLAHRVLPFVYIVFRPHMHWIIWTVICFMLMSEWPKGGRLERPGWPRFLAAWQGTGAGLLTFLLAGFLGFILFYRSPIPVKASFQNLMPAFVGLFTVPWLLLNVVSRMTVPKQHTELRAKFDVQSVVRGAVAGSLGGGFSAFFPGITGGVGGFLAGHATALRDDRAFLVSQGTSKLIYYVGGFLLLAVPGLRLTRGGGARLLRLVYLPETYSDYFMVLAAIGIAGAVSCALIVPLARGTIRLIERHGYRPVSCAALATVITIVFVVTGWIGLFVMCVATGIGLMPVLFGSRRMNCLGIILLPLACNMSGCGEAVANALRLL